MARDEDISPEPTTDYRPARPREFGAVYTPPWLVRRVVAAALDAMAKDAPPERLLSLRVLDPACGAGAFLIGAFDEIASHIESGGHLSAETAAHLADNVLHGVDIDAAAVEAAREALVQHARECVRIENPVEVEAWTDERRRCAALNIRAGNALSEPNLFADRFDVVVGNPPYVEAKRFKATQPDLHRYLKSSGRFASAGAKGDLAVPFLERGVDWLKPGGALAYVIQSRFLKTAYGRAARDWLLRENLITSIEDFGDLQVFAGRTTYTAILTLRRGVTHVRYRTYARVEDALAARPSLDHAVPLTDLSPSTWSLDRPDLLHLHRALAERHGTLGDGAKILVGLQLLWGKVYRLAPVSEGAELVTGVNTLAETATVERAAVRALCRNRGFYPFRADNADAWAIFPYDVNGNRVREIPWSEFRERFPLAADYLARNRAALESAVATHADPERWHLFTRTQNLVAQAAPKVLLPMTIEDPVAAWDLSGEVYQDNVNVNALVLANPTPARIKAATAVINSTLFSALARLFAGLNDGGWRKFNRQYAALVPFPWDALDSDIGAALTEIADTIAERQQRALTSSRTRLDSKRELELRALWKRLDTLVLELYGLSADERAIAARTPRRVDPVDRLARLIARAR